MKKLLNFIFALPLVLGILSSCETMSDPEVGYSSTYPISGEYEVSYNHAVYGADPFGAGYTKLYVYSTSVDNGKEVWITDNPNSDASKDAGFWNYKVKIPVNMSTLTFGLAKDVSVPNKIYGNDITVKIVNGKLIKGVHKMPSGVMSDSLYFDVVFSDAGKDLGVNDTLQVEGFRATGFLEDVIP